MSSKKFSCFQYQKQKLDWLFLKSIYFPGRLIPYLKILPSYSTPCDDEGRDRSAIAASQGRS